MHQHESAMGIHVFPILNHPPHTIPLGHPSAPVWSILYHASSLVWWFISHMIIYMFQCHSPKSSHPRPLPLFYISVSLLLSHIQGYHFHLSKFHIYALVYCIGEKAMATHSSTLAWKIPRVEEPGRLQSTGLGRVGHDWATSFSLFTFMHWRRKWQPTPVFLSGESHGQRSLVGYSP